VILNPIRLYFALVMLSDSAKLLMQRTSGEKAVFGEDGNRIDDEDPDWHMSAILCILVVDER